MYLKLIIKKNSKLSSNIYVIGYKDSNYNPFENIYNDLHLYIYTYILLFNTFLIKKE